MAHWFDKTTFVLLSLLVLLSPIPLASNRDWSWSLLAFLAAVLVLAWLLGALLSRRRLFTGLHWLIPLLFLLALAWAWVQAQPWVPADWKHPVWGLAGAALGLRLRAMPEALRTSSLANNLAALAALLMLLLAWAAALG